LPIEKNHARTGLDKFGQQIKTSGFARTVRTNQCVDAATLHRQVDPVYGHKAFEFFAEFLRLENAVSRHAAYGADELT
jgi:hypothetical protein